MGIRLLEAASGSIFSRAPERPDFREGNLLLVLETIANRLPQCFRYPLPVRAVPKDLPATAALPKPLQPGECSGRYPISYLLFGHFDQLSTASHAAGLKEVKAQLFKDESKLFAGTQMKGYKNRRLDAITDERELENSRVGR